MTRTLTEPEARAMGLWEGAEDVCGLPNANPDLTPEERAVLHQAQADHRAWRGLCPEDRARVWPIDEHLF